MINYNVIASEEKKTYAKRNSGECDVLERNNFTKWLMVPNSRCHIIILLQGTETTVIMTEEVERVERFGD